MHRSGRFRQRRIRWLYRRLFCGPAETRSRLVPQMKKLEGVEADRLAAACSGALAGEGRVEAIQDYRDQRRRQDVLGYGWATLRPSGPDFIY